MSAAQYQVIDPSVSFVQTGTGFTYSRDFLPTSPFFLDRDPILLMWSATRYSSFDAPARIELNGNLLDFIQPRPLAPGATSVTLGSDAFPFNKFKLLGGFPFPLTNTLRVIPELGPGNAVWIGKVTLLYSEVT
jgi:hypothetical protein